MKPWFQRVLTHWMSGFMASGTRPGLSVAAKAGAALAGGGADGAGGGGAGGQLVRRRVADLFQAQAVRRDHADGRIADRGREYRGGPVGRLGRRGLQRPEHFHH